MNRKTFLTVLAGSILYKDILSGTVQKLAYQRVKISGKKLKKLTFSFGFKQLYPDPIIRGLDMPGSFGKYGVDNMCGKIVRVLRFKNITDAVEDRYHLPRFILLAMMIEESTGMDLFPNAKDDGGIGLIHMQPESASEFSLKTYNHCTKRKCHDCGEALRDLIKEKNYDRKQLIQYDDRFHPIKNIDAAGRILAYWLQRELLPGLGPMRTAIKRYAGGPNYEEYWTDIVKNMAYLSNKDSMNQVADYFNEINPDLSINGKVRTTTAFEAYINIFQQQNDNYGLAEYKKLPKYDIINADGGTSMYSEYVNSAKKHLKPVCSK